MKLRITETERPHKPKTPETFAEWLAADERRNGRLGDVSAGLPLHRPPADVPAPRVDRAVAVRSLHQLAVLLIL